MWVSPVHISLTIIVGINRWIDIIPVTLIPNQRFAEWVFEWSVRRIGHQHTNAMTMQRGIQVILTVTLYGLDSPTTVLATAPGEVLQRSHCTMFGPVHHIGSAPQQPVVHKETCRTLLVHIGDILGRGIMRGIEEQGVADYQW